MYKLTPYVIALSIQQRNENEVLENGVGLQNNQIRLDI
jgi:hypothetical protein